jgi:hypothetical protein
VSDDLPVIQGRHPFIVDARYAPKRLNLTGNVALGWQRGNGYFHFGGCR